MRGVIGRQELLATGRRQSAQVASVRGPNVSGTHTHAGTRLPRVIGETLDVDDQPGHLRLQNIARPKVGPEKRIGMRIDQAKPFRRQRAVVEEEVRAIRGWNRRGSVRDMQKERRHQRQNAKTSSQVIDR